MRDFSQQIVREELREMYRCCIFDLDGTLLNTIYALEKSTNLTLRSLGLREASLEEIRRFVGDGYKKQMERALKACGDPELTCYEQALERYSRFFEENCQYRVEPYQGIRELLAFLKSAGIRIAVLSNKPHLRTVENIEGTFGTGYFDWIQGEQEALGIRRKPAPDGVFKCIEGLQVSLEECLYLGDTDTDMKTGQAAGVDTVGTAWGFRDRSELEACHPAYLVDDPAQVMDIVRKVNELL